MAMNGQGRKTIGTSSPKDRLDGQVLCPSLEKGNKNTEIEDPRGGSPVSLLHLLHLQGKTLKAFGTQDGYESRSEAIKEIRT